MQRARRATRASTRPWRSPPATARRSTSSSPTPSQAETALLGQLTRRAGIRPTELADVDLRAAQLRRRAPALPRHQRPGVDDPRRGRGPGPGQARLRGRAGGRHDRPADQPPLHAPRCRPASACAPRRRSAPARIERLLGRRRRSPSDAVGDLAARDVVIIGAGETSRADRPGAGRPRASRRSSSPTATPTARARWPSASAGTSSRSTSCPAAAAAPTSSSPRPPRRTRSSGRGARARSWPRATAGRCVLIDIAVPRDIDPACADARRRHAAATSTTCRPSSRATSAVREAERDRAEEIVEEEIKRFARWMGQLDVRADDRRAAPARRRRSSSRSSPRTPAAGSPCRPRDLDRIEAVARAVMQRAAARADAPAQDAGRAAVLRHTAACRSPVSCSGWTSGPGSAAQTPPPATPRSRRWTPGARRP